MVRRTSHVSLDRNKSQDYLKVAENFFEGARLAQEFEYWNAAGVLIVHSAIAYTDAITIKLSGLKSRGEDHEDAIILIEKSVANEPENRRAISKLYNIIQEKTLVSYSGTIYQRKDIERLWKSLERLRIWALNVLKG